ncbi:Uncharacterized iron-regulated protein [Fulvimarina manganoxydans]|uniref:Uncharacterized iron-regulated protein n=1 Tax=Fulvimarina manganoxydans TaxID=937218 RepID=A0A1W2DHC0_9HYPH|nr:ChaN family lipoprotein [Fulvimarina manganoxydans]SMC96921.1 Uncharacterized iron-regulated protein [Fulvimarina manganoxydans]
MKRRILIVPLAIGLVGAAWRPASDMVSGVLDGLPRQSADQTDFAPPQSAPVLELPYGAEGRSGDRVSIATATPFVGDDGLQATGKGAAAALEKLAKAHSRVASLVPLHSAQSAFFGTQGDHGSLGRRADDLLVVTANRAKDETDAAETAEERRSLATRLFDGDDADWQSAYYTDNSLTGTVVTSDGTASDMSSLVGAAKAARYVLLGEIHDNPDHHRLQAGIIDDLVEAGAKPAVVFEMIPETFADTLQALDGAGPQAMASLADTLDWADSGWPDFSIYAPIFESALGHGLSMRPGNLDRATVRRLSSEGVEAMPEAERRRLSVDQPLDPLEKDALDAELSASHCDLLPREALAPMRLAQRLRDGAMADAMISAAGNSGSAVLIAGAGHTRTDRGVPSLLQRQDPDGRSVAVQMVEVTSSEADDVADYGIGHDRPAPYDFTIFTPRADITDRCAEMRAAMERAGAR